MKQLITYLIILLINSVIIAQLPKWTDFNQRQKLYPTEQYLTGSSSESNIKKDALQPSFDYIEQLARGELIEKVQVQVQSTTKSETKDYDGVFNDFFRNDVETKSSLNLVGLKVEQYYDKKQKTTYILVYVKRIDLINFYKSQVDQNLSRIRNLLGSSREAVAAEHIQESFKAVYSTHVLFQETIEAQGYLTALGIHSTTELRLTDIEQMSSDAQSLFKELEKSKSKNLDAVSYCMSLVLSGRNVGKSDSLFVSQNSYEETGLVTAFSYRYQQLLKQQLSSNSNYATQLDQSISTKLLLKGTYWDKGDYLEIKNELYDQIKNTSIGSFKTNLYKTEIEKGLEYISSDIKNLDRIKNLKFTSVVNKLNGQVGFSVKNDLKVKVTDENGKVVADIPVSFIDEDKGINYGTVSSNSSGIAALHIDRIKSGSKSQVITGKLDLDNYLTIDQNNRYVQDVLKFTTLPNNNFYLTVSPSLIYFKVNEKNFGQALGIPVIEAGLKDLLSEVGYRYTETKSKSDLIVSINSDTRKGGEVSGIYFSFVDVTVSLSERESEKEIFKKSFNGYKASGTSFEHAGGKSYQIAKKDVCEKVVSLIGQ